MESSLKELSYYGTGGTVDQLYAPRSIEELVAVMKEVSLKSLPYFLLGAGSNSLVMDEHWPGAVITFNNLNNIRINENQVVAEAGVENTLFAESCLEVGLGGAGWMYRLPGQLGATVRMNARCYGGEISGIVRKVTAVTENGEIRLYKSEDVFRGYKDTIFMSNRDIVVEAEFELQEEDSVAILEHMEFCKMDRERKFQFLYPSCGCVFKNDYQAGVPSGLLLERSNVRRLNTEHVEISPHHANFVFNKGASAAEILEVTLQMREAVYQEFGVWMDYEMEILGQVPENLKNRLQEKREPRFQIDKLNPLREAFNKDL